MADIEVTEMAAETIQRNGERINELAHAIGDEHPLATRMARSWAIAIGQAFALVGKGGRVTMDSDTSLYLVTSYGMHVGVIFFRNRDFDDVMDDQGKAGICARHKQPMAEAALRCPQGHDKDADFFCYRVAIPVPGEWSLHS